MTYIKCVGIFFLIYSLIVAMIWLIKVPDIKTSEGNKILLWFVGWLTGGLWLFLLFKLI